MSDEFDDTYEPPRIASSALGALDGEIVAPIPELVANVYTHAPAPLRVRLLECLIRPVGPLALAVIAAGAFGGLLYRRGPQALSMSLEDAANFSAEQVLELARFVEQCSPEALLRIGSMLADSPVRIATVSSTLLISAIAVWRSRLRKF